MTNQANASGFYELIKHVIVEFALGGVTSLNHQYPWEHSILLNLGINKMEAEYRLDLSSAYGLCGIIDAKEISLHMTPGAAANKAPVSS